MDIAITVIAGLTRNLLSLIKMADQVRHDGRICWKSVYT